MGEPLLEIKDMFFKYPGGPWIFRGANLELHSGEQALIIGESGSGKTTFARILTNAASLVYGGEIRGSIRLLGKDLLLLNVEEISRRVHIIGQNPYLYFIEPVVREDIYSYSIKVHREESRARAALNRVIKVTRIWDLLDRYFFELSGGEARRVLVAKSLLADPILFIFDEPLMWLDDQGVEDFVNVLKLLKDLGKSAILLEHRFIPLLKVIDKVYLIRNGKFANVTDLLKDGACRQRPDQLERKNSVDSTPDSKELILETRNLHYRLGKRIILDCINLRLRRGELILIYGANGSGKTTLLKLLAGYLKPTKGNILRSSDLIYIPQNIMLFYTEETLEGEVKEVCRARGLREDCLTEGISRIRKLGLDPLSSPYNLSHGQMVRLAIELSRLVNASLLLDEPFSGITYKDRLYIMKSLREGRVTAIVASSNSDSYVDGFWSSTYLLDKGNLEPLKSIKGSSLPEAVCLYERLERGADA